MDGTHACSNCDAPLTGAFCPMCGQKRFVESDRRFSHLLRHFFAAATDLDGKFWRSLLSTLFQPGRLSRDHIDGRRARWMSPISLFLFANLLYFLAPGLTDLSLPFRYQVRGNIVREFDPRACDPAAAAPRCDFGGQKHSRVTEPLLRRELQRSKAEAESQGRMFELKEFAARYDAKSDAIGKLMVIVHVPFMALALWLAVIRRKRYFAEHFVVALGMLTFLLLFFQLLMKPAEKIHGWIVDWLGTAQAGMPGPVLLSLVLISLVYFSITCRSCYGSSWFGAIVQGAMAFGVLLLTSMLMYRPMQFVLSLWLM